MHADCTECQRLRIDRDAAIIEYVRLLGRFQTALSEDGWRCIAALKRELLAAQRTLGDLEQTIRRHLKMHSNTSMFG